MPRLLGTVFGCTQGRGACWGAGKTVVKWRRLMRAPPLPTVSARSYYRPRGHRRPNSLSDGRAVRGRRCCRSRSTTPPNRTMPCAHTAPHFFSTDPFLCVSPARTEPSPHSLFLSLSTHRSVDPAQAAGGRAAALRLRLLPGRRRAHARSVPQHDGIYRQVLRPKPRQPRCAIPAAALSRVITKRLDRHSLAETQLPGWLMIKPRVTDSKRHTFDVQGWCTGSVHSRPRSSSPSSTRWRRWASG